MFNYFKQFDWIDKFISTVNAQHFRASFSTKAERITPTEFGIGFKVAFLLMVEATFIAFHASIINSLVLC